MFALLFKYECMPPMNCLLFWYWLISVHKNSLLHAIYLLYLLYFKVFHKHLENETINCLMSEMDKVRWGEI